MNKFNTKLSAAVAMAAIMAGSIIPVAFADTNVVVKDNGAFSDTNVTVNNTENTTVNQTNATLIVNAVHASSSTGGNDANFNTGGDVKINTGDATTRVKIENTGSSNDATLPDCGCPEPTTTVKVKDNGAFSDNDVKVNNGKKTPVNQGNASAIINLVGASSGTGWNDANHNTGGDQQTTVKTGKSKTKVKINNTGSSNTLH